MYITLGNGSCEGWGCLANPENAAPANGIEDERYYWPPAYDLCNQLDIELKPKFLCLSWCPMICSIAIFSSQTRFSRYCRSVSLSRF